MAGVIKALAAHDVPLAEGLIAEAYGWLQDAGIEGPLSAEDGERMVQELGLGL